MASMDRVAEIGRLIPKKNIAKAIAYRDACRKPLADTTKIAEDMFDDLPRVRIASGSSASYDDAISNLEGEIDMAMGIYKLHGSVAITPRTPYTGWYLTQMMVKRDKKEVFPENEVIEI